MQTSGVDLAELQCSPREVAIWQRAQQQLMAGRHGHALAGYRELTGRHPQVAQLWFELGMAAGGDLDFAQAHEAFQKSISLAGKDVSLLVLIGQQYQRLRRFNFARECYERAVAADPASIHAKLSLGAWLEYEGRIEDAWNCAEVCLSLNPHAEDALYFKAFLLHRRGQNDAAAAALRDLIKMNLKEGPVKSSSRHLLGVALDQLGEYGEAMRWLTEAKNLLRTNDTVSLQRSYDQTVKQRRKLLAALTPATLRKWREGDTASEHRLAFLGGHPRSGTTLVEQILGAHPGVLAFDEPEAFAQELATAIAPSQSPRGLTLEGLNALSAATRDNLRARYFKSLLREAPGETSGKILLDKNPAPTASLPIWLRVFPDLKVIIPLRDPRDVVISCFFQNLSMTASSVNFLSLERTAQHYTDLTDVWLRMKELGGFNWMETRYEDVVTNLEREGRRMTEFLGLPWVTAQARHHETAQRKFVFAPTYHDVMKPVHQKAVGRWEHYADALKPVMAQLEDCCKRSGY